MELPKRASKTQKLHFGAGSCKMELLGGSGFGQVLGYIQEGEPLTLDLPNRKASIYTSSHFYLDDYPNAPEPVSETPLPHTSLNPAAAFETADEGYSGTPFPRPPREFTRPSFLPDSDDGGMDPGPRPPDAGGPHEGERHSGRGGDRGGRRGGRGGRGEERVREPDDAGPVRRRRLAGPHAENPEAATGTGPPTGRSASTANQRAGQRAAEVERAAAQDIESFASQQLAEAEARRRRRERRRRQRRPKAEGCWQHWGREPWLRRAPWARRREAWPWREQALPWSARRGR